MEPQETIPINRPITSRDDFKQQLKWLTIDMERLVRLNVNLMKGEVVHDLRHMMVAITLFAVAMIGILCGMVFLAIGIADWLIATGTVSPTYRVLFVAFFCFVEFGGIAAVASRKLGRFVVSARP